MFGSKNVQTERGLTVLVRAVALTVSGMMLASAA